MYLEIFGKEEGWITYREVMLAIAKEETKGFWYSRRGFCKFFSPADIAKSRLTCTTDIGLAVWLCCEAMAVSAAFATRRVNMNLCAIAIVASLVFGIMFFFFSAVLLIRCSGSSGWNVNCELQQALEKANSHRKWCSRNSTNLTSCSAVSLNGIPCGLSKRSLMILPLTNDSL